MHSQKLKQINHGVFHFYFCISAILILSIIQTTQSISLKINYISHQELSSKISNLRNLPEQYTYGSAFKINYYYSNLYLGEKMQKQGYILDTGSTITTATCGPICKHCGIHISPHYEDENIEKKIILCTDPICKQVSSKCHYTSRPRECSFFISYSEGSSLSGVYINEIVRFGNNYKNQTPHNIPIGCTKEENHLFFTQDANGIMGLANNENNFVEILYKNGAIENNIFSLCFSQLGGLFNIGEINNRTHLEKMKFVPMLLDRGKYFGVNLISISVNNHTVENYEQYNYNIFIDSGTTISYINVKIFDEILNLMNKDCETFKSGGKGPNPCGKYEYHNDYGHCFYFKTMDELNYAVNNYWPTIHFYLTDYDYIWRPQYYVFNISTSKKPGACTGINKSAGTKITLGSSWIIGHDVIFDRKKKLLGFAEANCGVNEEINKTSGLELVKDDYRLRLGNLSNNYTNKFGYNANNKSNYDQEVKISSKSLDKYDTIIIWQYVILAIFSFAFFIIIILILSFKYLRKNDMKKIDIEVDNNNNNSLNKTENKIKESSYTKISTDADSKESKDNNKDRDIQPMIVIES